jgi:hypothetical protein
MNKYLSNKLLLIKIIFLLILIIAPWSISDLNDNIQPEKITSDLRFYEINTCSISLSEFLLSNLNVLYQDHYKIRFNNYSSAYCFGQITGIDQINHEFYISIGSNSIISLFIQSIFWILVISFVRKNKKEFKLSIIDYFSIGLTSVLAVFGIYAESRFYAKSLYYIDLNQSDQYINLFTYFFFINYFLYVVLINRSDNIKNYLPFTFIFMMLFNGFNLYLPILFLCTYGIKEVLTKKVSKKYIYLSLAYLAFWSYQAIGSDFYLKPDKIRGLTSTSYNFSTNIYWGIILFTLVVGIISYLQSSAVKIDKVKFQSVALFSGSFLVLIGYLSSAFPSINFLTYYYAGLTKYPTLNQNLFQYNEWGEKVAWRGMYPSAESSGELFGLAILILALSFFSSGKIRKVDFINLIICSIGLYASNNQTAFILLIFCILYKIINTYKIPKGLLVLFITVFLIMIIFIIGFDNLSLELSFISNNMIGTGYAYGLEDGRSSSIEYLENDLSNTFLKFFITLIGIISFFINRSELWGLFFARYNPNFFEFLFGGGSFNLAKHYSEIKLLETRSFLLPHSSLLNILLYFGFLFLCVFVFIFSKKIIQTKRTSDDSFLILIYIFINLIKSDSILYISTILIYFLLFLNNTFKKEKISDPLQ